MSADQMQTLLAAAERLAHRNIELRSFLLRLIDPDDLGHAVTQEVRELTQAQLKLNPRQDPQP